MALDKDAQGLVAMISNEYILTMGTNGAVAYHIKTGRSMNRDGFVKFTSKHFGTVNMGTEEKPVIVSAGEVWWNFHFEHKREVRDTVMEPTGLPEDRDPNGLEVFNRWHVLKRGMVVPNRNATPADIEILLDHLMFLSDGDAEVVMYFMNWLAWMYQHPEAKIPVAILFYSKNTRMGKSMLYDILSRVFAHELVGTCTGKQLQKNFDDAIEHRRLVIINEMARSEKADAYESFKNTVSEPYIQFEGKGRASRQIKNIAHYIITTNNEDALPLMDGDGRIAVFSCTADRKPNKYYKALGDWMVGDGPANLAGVLATWQFAADWDAMAPSPQTDAAKHMQKAARSSLAVLVQDMIDQGAAPFDKDCGTILEITTKLETMFGAIEKRINIRTVADALATCGGEYLGQRGYRKSDGKQTTIKAWAWRSINRWSCKTGPEVARECGLPVATGDSE